ncbi:hypothetical protein DQW50_06565 [Halorubrum sp. 48-1-W]|uniref:hypothetical protein n=1 Tax=Halorubrum sp. 48-1-W TaxID=2249761 RepID=UPI000DCCDC31|nr:hypothetical protein [Halorubrum sp. 48-1-W]RAW45868.1 hypothetical protein DQW50_06565 [Halorubrum sp. 48-1-W]
MTERSGRYVVVRVRNDHDAMTVRDPSRNSTFHVVECDGEEFEDVLDEVGVGDVVRLDLRRIGRRGNAWCVTDARSVGDATPVVGD